MTSVERICKMLLLAGDPGRLFPATDYYNETWLLRLTIDWFARQPQSGHPLNFVPGARWFSEARLPSQFLATNRDDQLAEGWTHADTVIGHFAVGGSSTADLQLVENASQLVVVEAKLFSPLSAGVTNARYFDQAARNVACIAEVLCRRERDPQSLASLGFYVLAPAEQIATGLFDQQLGKASMRQKVARRVAEYSGPAREAKETWVREWFAPTLERISILALSWESLLNHARSVDPVFGEEVESFYTRCCEFGRIQDRG